MAKLNDLYFGIRNYDFNTEKLTTENLFASIRILHSVAVYRALDGDMLKNIDPLSFCFGDTRGHVEYEFLTKDTFSDKWEQVNIWEMYVKPNANYLMSLVNSVDKEDAKRWLDDYNARIRQQLDEFANYCRSEHDFESVSD